MVSRRSRDRDETPRVYYVELKHTVAVLHPQNAPCWQEMADDDDWETDPDFENNMTETEKRRAGNVEHLNELNAATQSMSMDAVRARAHSLHARAGEIDIANVRAEKAAADKLHVDASTSAIAPEKPAVPAAKPLPGSLAGRWEENARTAEREAALAAQSREAEAKAKREAEAETYKARAKREAEAEAQKAKEVTRTLTLTLDHKTLTLTLALALTLTRMLALTLIRRRGLRPRPRSVSASRQRGVQSRRGRRPLSGRSSLGGRRRPRPMRRHKA